MITKLIAKAKSLNAAFEAWNFKDYDKHQVATMDAQLTLERKQEEAQRRVLNSNSTYAEWYKKMLAVKQAREADLIKQRYQELATSSNEALKKIAQDYLAQAH